MTEIDAVPPKLLAWTADRLDEIARSVRKCRSANSKDAADAHRWLTTTLAEVNTAQRVAHQMSHILTAYALRERVMPQAEAARIAGLTITGATSRAASRITMAEWDTIFGER